MERRDQLWRDELKHRDQSYWKWQCKRDDDLARILEGIDKTINDSFVSRNKFWLDRLDSYNHYLKSIYYGQVNMGKTMKSLAIR